MDTSPVAARRGRPPIHGKYSKNPEVHGKNGGQTDNPAKSVSKRETTSPIDAAYLSEALVLVLESGDEILAKILFDKIAEVAPEKAEEFQKLQRQVGLNEKDKQMLRASITAICAKYNLLTKFGPELLLVVFLAQYGYRQVKLSKFVAKEVAEREGKDRKKKVNGEKTELERTPQS